LTLEATLEPTSRRPEIANGGPKTALLPSSVTVAAVISWLLTLASGAVIVKRWDLNPLTTQGVVMPIAVGVLGGMVLLGVALLVRRAAVIGVVAGAYAGWIGMTILAMLNGTPYGYGHLTGDAGRMSALVMHFTTTWHNSDAANPDLPAEYPPLYPMLVGRVAALTGRSGWALLGVAQPVLVSAAVLLAFLLWKRMLPATHALLAASTVTLALAEPSKCNEIVALAVFVPFVLASFTPPPGVRPLNPLAAGAIAGLMVPWYPNLLMLGLLGVGAVMVYGWWQAESRRAYALRAAAVTLVAFVVASWYIVPLAREYATGTTDVVADLYLSGSLADRPFTIFTETPGVVFTVVVFALQVIGVVGAVALLRRAWWAAPLTLLLVGVLVVRAVMLLRFISTGHAFLLYYVPYVIKYVTLAAGVLVLVTVWRRLGRLLAQVDASSHLVGTLLVAIFLGSVGANGWTLWTPAPNGMADTARAGSRAPLSTAAFAHAELLPSGRPVRYSTRDRIPRFPVSQVVSVVERTLGEDARPVVLSYDQRLFVFQPWPNFLPPSRTSSSALVRWNDRRSAVAALAKVTDAQTFADRSAKTAFGRIEVFVLQVRANGWYWKDIRFDPAAFAGPAFTVRPDLPAQTVVAVRVR
jgi:hypothetical protein